ncbi:MAG TPA: dihydrodipicolinate synthase family protein [Pirellulales bacterium]|nr:dihydrodipicolinate synthase family protein [Pirellulales bacterium]
MATLDPDIQSALQRGVVIPACPLALDAQRKWNERRQRALLRYYLDAGAGGIAIGVHTTQFAIRDPQHGLYRPLLRFASAEMATCPRPVIRVAGVCGGTKQALAEAAFARECGYHAGLLNLSALAAVGEDEFVEHCRRVAEVLPVFGFYLNPAIGGRLLPFSFWRQFAEIERVVAIKIAPFNRYQTLDVVRAVVEAGRDDIALYTGNDDNIVADLITPFRFESEGHSVERRIVGGLLGQWAVGTRAAVGLLDECHRVTAGESPSDALLLSKLLRDNVALTDINAALFDAAHDFAGCIPGVHEVLRRQGLLEGVWCLDPRQTLSPGQAEEIDRVMRVYAEWFDGDFVRENLDRWLTP